MCKKCLLFFLVIVLFVSPVIIVYPVLAQERTDDMEELLATVSTEVPPLEAEAARLGIPAAETKRYVVNLRALNKEYQAGDMTRTEYISNKRLIIERMK